MYVREAAEKKNDEQRNGRMKQSILLLAMLVTTLIFTSSVMVLAQTTTLDTATEGGNDRIAFSNNATGDYDVYTMRPDGSDPKNLTNSPSVDDYHVYVSPDGS